MSKIFKRPVWNYDFDITGTQKTITCLRLVKITFCTSNLIGSAEEDWRHKWECQRGGLEATPAAEMCLKIHRVLILALEQSKIPHIKAILMDTVPEVQCLKYNFRRPHIGTSTGALLQFGLLLLSHVASPAVLAPLLFPSNTRLKKGKVRVFVHVSSWQQNRKLDIILYIF